MDTKVYDCSDSVLDFKTVINILTEPDDDKISSVPPTRPRGGEMYLINNKSGATCDQYMWCNKGCNEIPKKNPVMQRRDFKLKRFVGDKIGDSGFRRVCYFSHMNDYVLVHYIGDETLFVARPHGNSKQNEQVHTRTRKSTLSTIKRNVSTKEPNADYIEGQESTNVSAAHQGISTAKNRKQIENQRYQVKKITQDAAYNTLQVAYEVGDFVLEFSFYPEIKVVLGNSEILKEFNRMLALDETVLLSYDTTFNIGDFFVSALVMKHPFFRGRCSIPIAFLIHDRKNQKSHDIFWKEIADNVPNVLTREHVIVTDREASFTKAINRFIPKAKIFYCWNHVKRDVKFWVKTHGGKSDDLVVYSTHIDSLLRSESESDFENKLAAVQETWSQSFVQYFDANLKKDLLEHSCKFIVEPSGVYDSYSGVTNNISEGLNCLLKNSLGWKNVTLDGAVLAFHYLQQFYRREILRGFCDVGDFQLKSEHRYRKFDPEMVDMPHVIAQPEKIIDIIQGKLREIEQTKQDTDSSTDEGNEKVTVKVNTQQDLATSALAQKKVFHCPDAKAFIVEGTKGDKHTVTVFPEKCGCPALGGCWHIMAAKLSIGLDIGDEKKIYNLTQLTKNHRKKPNKCAGKKRPRPIDKEDLECIVNPAPDASVLADMSVTDAPICSSTPAKSARKKMKFDTPKALKLPNKLEVNLPIILEEEPTSRTDEVEDTNAWINHNGNCLTQEHKKKIENKEKLCDRVINFVSKAVQEQYSINGVQYTGLVPIFDKKWQYHLQFERVQQPAAQIHHNGKDHWVFSASDCTGVYVLDSAFKKNSAIVRVIGNPIRATIWRRHH